MSARQWYNDALRTSQGIVECDFSFQTNGANDPDTTKFRGCGGLTGADASGGANSGPSAVASIVRVGQGTGKFLVTLADSYRFVISKDCSIDDAADAMQARCGAVANEGTGNGGTPVTVVIQVRDGAGTAQDTTGRVISCSLVLKNSGNGA